MSTVNLAFDIPLLGKPARVEMRLLPWSEIARVSIKPEEVAAAHLKPYFESNLKWSIDTIDGQRLVRAVREALLSDPVAIAAVFSNRFDIYRQIRAAGRMYAQCPHCRDAEIEMSLLSLFDTVGVMPPDMISTDLLYFRSPMSSDSLPAPPGRPTQFAYASRIRFELPTAILNMPRNGFEGGELGRVAYERYAELMDRWETDGINVPPEKSWQTSRTDSFRTTIWLLAALGETTLETFEQMPGVDVFFLDALYYLAFAVDVPAHAQERPCPSCARPFVPVGS